MESDSTNKISKPSVSVNLNDETNSRKRKLPKLFITLIIFFILIIVAIISVLTIIKHDYDSELPANNPEKAIQSICKPTPYYDTCFRYMSDSLYKNKKISSSQIFSISLHTTIKELKKITYSLKSYNSPSDDQSTPSQCEYLYFNSTLSQLNSYLAIDEEKNKTMRSEMIDWLVTERPKIARCLYWLGYEKGLDTENVNNCLIILVNMNIINEMFNPSINSVFNFSAFRSSGKSIVALLFSDLDFVDMLYVFGVQYIFLLLLVFCLLRVW